MPAAGSRRVVVPDASVILKAVLPGPAEAAADAARSIFDGWERGAVDVALPDLWSYEVGNILARRCPDLASPMLDALFALSPRIHPMTPGRAASVCSLLSRARGATFYDASYHALAIELGGTFVTADVAYFRLASKIGSIEVLPGIKT